MENSIPLTREKHVKYFLRCLDILPSSCAHLDSIRMTILYFALHGLDTLNSIDRIPAPRRAEIIDWVYAMQLAPPADNRFCGFRGCPAPEQDAHIAHTYTALCILLILGDEFSHVRRREIAATLATLQLPDGSFTATNEGSESDIRFVFCAAAIAFMLDDWSGVDVPRMNSYIRRCISYEGAFANTPNSEAHGGSTYCAVAALQLNGSLKQQLNANEIAALTRWCLQRQYTGFAGRPNKPWDTCYSFWIAGTLHILGLTPLVAHDENRQYLLEAQDPTIGGFSKYPNHFPDPLHSCMAAVGLSLSGVDSLQPVCATLNIGEKASDRLEDLRRVWRQKDGV